MTQALEWPSCGVGPVIGRRQGGVDVEHVPEHGFGPGVDFRFGIVVRESNAVAPQEILDSDAHRSAGRLDSRLAITTARSTLLAPEIRGRRRTAPASRRLGQSIRSPMSAIRAAARSLVSAPNRSAAIRHNSVRSCSSPCSRPSSRPCSRPCSWPCRSHCAGHSFTRSSSVIRTSSRFSISGSSSPAGMNCAIELRNQSTNTPRNSMCSDPASHSVRALATRAKSAGDRLCSSPSTARIRLPGGTASAPARCSSTTRYRCDGWYGASHCPAGAISSPTSCGARHGAVPL